MSIPRTTANQEIPSASAKVMTPEEFLQTLRKVQEAHRQGMSAFDEMLLLIDAFCKVGVNEEDYSLCKRKLSSIIVRTVQNGNVPLEHSPLYTSYQKAVGATSITN